LHFAYITACTLVGKVGLTIEGRVKIIYTLGFHFYSYFTLNDFEKIFSISLSVGLALKNYEVRCLCLNSYARKMILGSIREHCPKSD